MKHSIPAMSLLMPLLMSPLTVCAEPVPPDINLTSGLPIYSESLHVAPADLDASGAIGVSDLIRMQRFLLGAETLSDPAMLAADVNHDGAVDVFDLALAKTALVKGTVHDTWGVRYDIQGAQFCGGAEFSGEFDSQEELAKWLGEASWLHFCDMTIYPEQYDAAFFEGYKLAVLALPCFGGEPLYQVRGIRDEGDTLRLLLGDSDASLSGTETVQLTFVEVPRSLAQDKSLDWDVVGDFYHLLECIEWSDPVRDHANYRYTSPDGSYTLQVSQTIYDHALPNSVSFAWIEEDAVLELETFSVGPAAPFSADEETGDFTLVWGETGVTVTFGDSEDTEKTVTYAYPDHTMTRQNASFSIGQAAAPEITSVTVTADCWGTLSKKCSIRNMYRAEWMSKGLVGRIGAPFRYETSGTVENAEITIHYDESELRGIPETNLVILYDNGNGYPAVYFTQDTEADTLTFTPENEGLYIVADAYTWYSRWGIGTTAAPSSIDKMVYPSNWERECDTGSIMELADKAWAAANAPDFHVSTPQELASAVYYVNAVADNTSCTITLEQDIDLAGFDWAPLGWDGAEFGSVRTQTECFGVIDGQGHTIRNLHVAKNGFVSRSSGLTVQNITFENASVDGGRNIGIVCGETYCDVRLVNVHASGTIQAPAGAKVGALCGNGIGASFTDCTADVTVNGSPFTYFSDLLLAVAETVVQHPINLTVNEDNTISREESEYTNLSWVIYCEGEHVLTRSATKEMTLDLSKIYLTPPGAVYTIYVEAWIDGHYVPISDSVEVSY